MEESLLEIADQLKAINEQLTPSSSASADEYVLSLVRTVALCFGGAGAFIGACAALFIPRRIANAAAKRERRVATTNLIRDIKGSPVVLDRLARMYSYRKFKEGDEKYTDPYDSNYNSFEHDLICILNFFDVASAEIDAGYIEPDLIRATADDMIVGAYDRMEELGKITECTTEQIHSFFPHLTKLGKKWSDGVPPDERLVPSIKRPKSPETPSQ